MTKLLIYGATGYTGRLVAERAKAAGLNFEIAGRDAAKLVRASTELSVGHRVFSLDDPDELPGHLAGCSVLLNCAGPFAKTAEPLMSASMSAGAHYLDITAEINVYRGPKPWAATPKRREPCCSRASDGTWFRRTASLLTSCAG